MPKETDKERLRRKASTHGGLRKQDLADVALALQQGQVEIVALPSDDPEQHQANITAELFLKRIVEFLGTLV